jgi:alkanesulfonate monooxygenase SsuD/methylene tetrahydromethanopterin reductase-like flavin-dependent oxidoreductase (luciferase family)
MVPPCGLGAGDSPFEHTAVGYPTDNCVSRFEEALTIFAGVLREDRIDFYRQYYQAQECELRPRGPRDHGPPLLLGTLGLGARMLRLVAEQADGWNGWLVYGRSRPDAVPPLRERLDAACWEYGRDPPSLGRTVAVRVTVLGRTVPLGEPLSGTVGQLAAAFRRFARHKPVADGRCSGRSPRRRAPQEDFETGSWNPVQNTAGGGYRWGIGSGVSANRWKIQ